jgi:predicted HTH domain antitoxin
LKIKDEYHTLKSSKRKAKLKYAISLVNTLINSSDKSSIKTDLSQIWKLTGLSKNEFDVLFLKDKGVDIYKYCKDKNTDCKC